KPDLLAAPLGIDRQVDLRVLELVAEAEGAALLVVAASPPQPRPDRLIARPVVDDRVERRVGRLHAVRGEARPPARRHLFERLAALLVLDEAGPELDRGFLRLRRREGESNRPRFAGCEHDLDLESRNRVFMPPERRCASLPEQRRRSAEAAVAAEKRRLVSLRRDDRFGRRKDADVRKARVPEPESRGRHVPHVVSRDDRAKIPVELRLEEELSELASRGGRDAAAPFEVAAKQESPGPAGRVSQCRLPDLGPLFHVTEQRPPRLDSGARRLERRVTEAVAARKGIERRPRGCRRERPEVPAVRVLHVEKLPRKILDQGLLPACHDGELRVFEERKAAPRLTHDEPGAGIRDDVDPWARGSRVRDHVFPAVFREVAVCAGAEVRNRRHGRATTSAGTSPMRISPPRIPAGFPFTVAARGRPLSGHARARPPGGTRTPAIRARTSPPDAETERSRGPEIVRR